jgi:acetyltransferase-like isoleucine patch superfamily enzyme
MMAIHNSVFIGEHSIIGEDVQILEDSKIWHYCNIYGCTIGRNTQIGSYSEIKSGVRVGDNCRFQSYVFVSEGTQIGNHVFLGPRVTILNDKYPSAIKAINKTWRLVPVILEDEVSIGGNVTILPGIRIGRGTMVGGGSVVTKNIPPGEIWFGNPAKRYEKR